MNCVLSSWGEDESIFCTVNDLNNSSTYMTVLKQNIKPICKRKPKAREDRHCLYCSHLFVYVRFFNFKMDLYLYPWDVIFCYLFGRILWNWIRKLYSYTAEAEILFSNLSFLKLFVEHKASWYYLHIEGMIWSFSMREFGLLN